MCTLPSFGFGSSTSLLCLFCWFDSAPTLLVQVDWASGIALCVPTLSVKSLYNRSECTRSFWLQGVPGLRRQIRAHKVVLAVQSSDLECGHWMRMRALDADAGIGRCCGHWELIGDIGSSLETLGAHRSSRMLTQIRAHKVFLSSRCPRTSGGHLEFQEVIIN